MIILLLIVIIFLIIIVKSKSDEHKKMCEGVSNILNEIPREVTLNMTKDDLNQFLSIFNPLDELGKAMCLVASTIMRLHFQEKGLLKKNMFIYSERDINRLEKLTLCVQINGWIKGFQSENLPEPASGLMIWLHTLRCISYPEIEPQVRQIWKKLSASKNSVPKAMEFISTMTPLMGLTSASIVEVLRETEFSPLES